MSLCPICRKNPTLPDYKPFCSRRCADVDLQRWLTGAYVMPVDDEDETPSGSESTGEHGD